MKFTLTLLACCLMTGIWAQTRKPVAPALSPLSAYSAEWNKPQYRKCNTAANAKFMTQKEKDIIYILNLMRINPKLFRETVAMKYPDKTGKGYIVNWTEYYQTLLDTLLVLTPQNLLYPDKDCFTSALCHATSSGASGYVGHVRLNDECNKKRKYNGECCDYGYSDPLDIVMALLYDIEVPSLGHRMICMSSYQKIGVSIQPHKRYGHTAVLDFSY